MTEEAVKLITPYGGKLVHLLISGPEREQVVAQASHLPSLQLGPRALCDLELLTVGGFSPLDRFMGAADYQSVLHKMRLADGMLFPIPITLTADPRELPAVGSQMALRDARNHLLAILNLEEVFEWNPALEAEMVLGTTDSRHPLVSEMITWKPVCISGRLQVVEIPRTYDSPDLRLTPTQTRARLMALGNDQVVAFQTRNPLHRAHEELTKRAAALIDGTLLLHPSVGMTKPGDVDHYSRVRIYRTMVERYYDASRTLLGLLPLAMRMAGPREAIWHALIRRNYGASHFIVGRDHAGPRIVREGHFTPPMRPRKRLPTISKNSASFPCASGRWSILQTRIGTWNRTVCRQVPVPSAFLEPRYARTILPRGDFCRSGSPDARQQKSCRRFTCLGSSRAFVSGSLA